MKIPEFLKKTAAAVFAAAPSPLAPDRRKEAAAAHAKWHADWAEAQRQYRATHPPGTRVPMPRFLGLPWPPPPDPNGLNIPYRNQPGDDE